MKKCFETETVKRISIDGQAFYAVPEEVLIEKKEKILERKENHYSGSAGGYQIQAKCMNCQKKQTIIIPEGNLFEPFPVVKQSRIVKQNKGMFSKAKTINCHYCGCSTLARGGE